MCGCFADDQGNGAADLSAVFAVGTQTKFERPYDVTRGRDSAVVYLRPVRCLRVWRSSKYLEGWRVEAELTGAELKSTPLSRFFVNCPTGESVTGERRRVQGARAVVVLMICGQKLSMGVTEAYFVCLFTIARLSVAGISGCLKCCTRQVLRLAMAL